jgi:hypothetical protein
LEEWIGADYATVVKGAKTATVKNLPDTTTEHESWRYTLRCNTTLLRGARQARASWFTARGFSPHSLERFRFGHTGERFVIPFWYDGEFRGYKLRRDERYCDPDEQKYLNPKGMPGVIIRPNPRGNPTVITEGELDAYLLAQWGLDAVTTTSGAGSLRNLLRSEQGLLRERVFVLLDNDEAGQEAADHITSESNLLHNIRLPTGNDITEYLAGIDAVERGSALRSLLR